jgi:hypothetical protein
MAVTVDLDHQIRLRAIQTGDEPTDRMLAADLEPELNGDAILPGGS